MPRKSLHVALLGSKFMGRAHSNAYLNVAKFFDLPVEPVMDLVSARDAKALRAFADQWGNPTYVPDLARTLVELCRAEVSGLFHMGGAAVMSRPDLALALADFFDLDSALVQPVPTGEVGLKAERPLRSGLKTDTLSLIHI